MTGWPEGGKGGVALPAIQALDSVEAGYRDLVAVREVSLEVRAGEVVALIGGNGAGKTTTLRAISGLLPLRRGRIEFEGERIDGRASAARIFCATVATSVSSLSSGSIATNSSPPRRATTSLSRRHVKLRCRASSSSSTRS